jgi:hypothetical protein
MSECLENIPGKAELGISPIMQFTFLADARWNAERRAVKVGVARTGRGPGEAARIPTPVLRATNSRVLRQSSPLTAHPLGAHYRAQAA